MIRYTAIDDQGIEKAEGIGVSDSEALEECEKAVSAYLKTAPGTHLYLMGPEQIDYPMVDGLRWW